MKRVLLSVLMTLGLLGSSITSANAIFGLSTCEKAKKEILSLESTMNSVKSIRGSRYVNDALREVQYLDILSLAEIAKLESLRLNDPIRQIWKVSFNNSQCFTNTQKLQIKELGTQTIVNYFWHETETKYRQLEICRGKLSYFFAPTLQPALYKKCRIGEVEILSRIRAEYLSIYAY